jgi:hypothetical protein
LITIFADAGEIHPLEFVTVKLYVPGASALTVAVAALPVNEPGLIVQLPLGRPVNITLPAGTAHVGCVMVPTAGAAGTGLIDIVTGAEVVGFPVIQAALEVSVAATISLFPGINE